jgi:hypothetical protein
MLRRSVRVSLVLLTVALTAAAVWRATTNEQARGRMRLAAQHDDAAVAEVLFGLADLRASFYAMLAPGQGDFWATRANEQMDDLRRRVLEVDTPSTASGLPLTSALDRIDRLAVAAAQTRELAADDRPDEAAGMANELSLMAGGVMAVWIVALILLVPVPAPPRPAADNDRDLDAPAMPAAEIDRRPSEPMPVPAPPSASDADPAVHPPPPTAMPPAPESVPEPAPVRPVAADLVALAALCGDLGRVTDAADLPPLLSRAADVLGARGVVIWLLDADRTALLPAMAHGYDPQVLARVGALAVHEDNLTAQACRTGAPAYAAATTAHAAAVAVPIVAADGVGGVLAAELMEGSHLETAGALAAVMAAQLASLIAGR